jgi:hypothetical protein
MIADRRRLAFGTFRHRPLDTFDRIVGDGIFLTEVLEQRSQRGEPVPDCAATTFAPFQLFAPGDDMRTRDDAEFLRRGYAGEAHEISDCSFIGTLGVGVVDIGEPLHFGGHVGQLPKLLGGEQAALGFE